MLDKSIIKLTFYMFILHMPINKPREKYTTIRANEIYRIIVK